MRVRKRSDPGLREGGWPEGPTAPCLQGRRWHRGDLSFCHVPAAMPGCQPNPALSLGWVSLGTWGWGKGGSEISLLQLQEPVLQLLFPFNDNWEPL